MTKVTLAFAADHAGFEMKQQLISYANSLGFEVIDHGTHNTNTVDYPDYVPPVVKDVLQNRTTLGVIICGSGIGMDIAANRHAGILSALCHNSQMAKMARKHNNANILCLGSRFMDIDAAKDCLQQFVTTDFETGGRHQRRVEKLG